jgi:hypothetical protein
MAIWFGFSIKVHHRGSGRGFYSFARLFGSDVRIGSSIQTFLDVEIAFSRDNKRLGGHQRMMSGDQSDDDDNGLFTFQA